MQAAAPVPPDARSRLPSQRSLKVITYNILAPKYAGFNNYCPPQYLAWEYRRAGVLRELEHHGADLMGLQECDMDFFNGELRRWMADRGMQGEFLPRQVGPVPGPTEGIALMWRSSALEAVDRRSVVFAEMDPRVGGLPAEVAGTRPWAKLRELGEGAVMALLRHRPTGQLLLSAVTHLFWNPAFPDVKALQAALLCGEVDAFRREAVSAVAGAGSSVQAPPPPPPPLVLFGDFNSLAVKWLPDMFDPEIPTGGLSSGVYTLLSGGALPPEHPDHPASRVWDGEGPSPAGGRFPAVPLSSAGLQLASLCVEAFGREPPLTTRTASWAGCLDYVWLTRTAFAVASALSLPFDDGGSPPMGPSAQGSAAGAGSKTAAGSDGGGGGGDGGGPTWRDPMADITFSPIPDEQYPSDHLAVGGEVVLLPAGEA